MLRNQVQNRGSGKASGSKGLEAGGTESKQLLLPRAGSFP